MTTKKDQEVGVLLAHFPKLSETFILNEILALRELGLKVHIFALKKIETEKVHPQAKTLLNEIVFRPPLCRFSTLGIVLSELLKKPFLHMRILIEWLFLFGLSPLFLLKCLRNYPALLYFRMVSEKKGISHLHAHFAGLPAELGRAMARLLDCEYSLSMHAKDIYTHAPSLLARQIYTSKFTVTCNRFNREFLCGICPDQRQKIKLAYHGIPVTDFSSGMPVKGHILSVGRLVEKKGMDVLIEACAILRERGIQFQCSIIGEGPMRSDLENRVELFQLQKQVFFLGQKDRNEMIQLYQQTSIFVLASLQAADGDIDGLPNVLMEAMASALPVVSTRLAAIPELIENGVSGLLVEPEKRDELADAMQLLLESETLRLRLGDKARERVEDLFSLNQHIGYLSKLLND